MANDNNSKPKNAIEAFKGFIQNFTQGKPYVLKSDQDKFWNQDCSEAEKTYQEYCSHSTDEKGKDKKFDDVIKDIKGQKNNDLEKMIDIINHAVWLWALPNNRKTHWISTPTEEKYNEDILNIKGVAGGGSGYVQKKTNGVRFILYLFTEISKKDKNEISNKDEISKIKKVIKDACKQKKYQTQDQTYDVPDGVKNLLLYLCDSEKYEPIASTDDKKKIVKAFGNYIENDKPKAEKDAIEDLDSKITKIKGLFCTQGETDFSFYKNSLPLIWKGESVKDLSLVQKLEYKKAMILYGPPGTGKTYSAMELAKEIIVRDCIVKAKKGDKNLKDLSQSLNDIQYNEQISYLQFHINYNYEDFIAGQSLNNGKIVTKKGFVFDVIENATKEENKGKPYVVILDEINRTDISRVFGELFTAIEKRGTDVTLMFPDPNDSSKRLTLNVPDNVYFIGTMNEIDFSLERVDFALRRRFVWELLDYNEDALEDIITERLKAVTWDNSQLDNFCNVCTALNKKVAERMDETYHIGHAFFAEIANIYLQLEDCNGDRWKKAKEILWQISIRPTLEAYCGTMDKSEKDKYLKDEFYKAFFGKEDKSDNNGED